MQSIFFIAANWLAIAVVAAIVARHLKISVVLVEICLGVVFAALSAWLFGPRVFGSDREWLQFLASTGAVVLTFLAGAELDPAVIRTKLAEVSIVGVVGFVAPFLGAGAVAHFILRWTVPSSLLAGIAMSTTSVAVVYAVMIDTGLNKTDFGKGVLGACFVNDLATVVALGLVFAPFTYKTLIFIGVSTAVIAALPTATKWLTRVYGNRTAAIRTRTLLAVLFGLGALSYWSGNEAVLPAYVAGIVLAEFASSEHQWIRRLRTLTTGFLTPFYFIRAGSLVSLPALVAAPLVLLALFLAKVGSKFVGLYPIIGKFRRAADERWYYTLMMSTGLTFGTISSLFGLSHGIIDRSQYSLLVATVIASAVIPTLIASRFFLPRHLVPDETQRR